MIRVGSSRSSCPLVAIAVVGVVALLTRNALAQETIISNFTETPNLFTVGLNFAVFTCDVDGDRCTILGAFDNVTGTAGSQATLTTAGEVWSALNSAEQTLIVGYCQDADPAECQAECTAGCSCTLLEADGTPGAPCDSTTFAPTTPAPVPVSSPTTPTDVTCANRVNTTTNGNDDDTSNAVCLELMGGENNTVAGTNSNCLCYTFCNDGFAVCDDSEENTAVVDYVCPAWVEPPDTDFLADRTPPTYPGIVSGCSRQDRITAGFDYALNANASNFIDDEDGNSAFDDALNSTGTGAESDEGTSAAFIRLHEGVSRTGFVLTIMGAVVGYLFT